MKLICVLTESLGVFGEVHFDIGDVAHVSLREYAKDLFLLNGLYVAPFELDQVVRHTLAGLIASESLTEQRYNSFNVAPYIGRCFLLLTNANTI